MKKLLSLLSISVLLQSTNLTAQPAQEKDAEGYVNGQILLSDNSTVTGTIKDNIRKKGEVTLLRDGKKTKYKAGEINSLQLGSSNYITNNYTFYEIIWQGKNITLLRKANEPSGVQYNGVEPVVISGSDGDVDDYFVKKNNESSVQLLSKTNVKEVLGKICTACITTIEATTFDITAIKKSIETCDKCK
jgi:hypothetical protein